MYIYKFPCLPNIKNKHQNIKNKKKTATHTGIICSFGSAEAIRDCQTLRTELLITFVVKKKEHIFVFETGS